MQGTTSPADDLCAIVAGTPQISNSTARIGAWIVGTAARLGGFPLRLTVSRIRNGFTAPDGTEIPGTGARHESIQIALEWFRERGYLNAEDGSAVGFGHNDTIYTWRTK